VVTVDVGMGVGDLLVLVLLCERPFAAYGFAWY